MSSWLDQLRRCAGPAWVAGTLVVTATAVLAQPAQFAGIGRAATPREVQAWDIDVRPDFKGLPPGQGSVAQGQDIWEAKCASCHGVFGESNEVFAPLVGGTTADDVKTGRVARLTDAGYPGRTTLMKVPTVSTLWDYIHRAMPWNAPKTLSTDEVYALTAFLLNLGSIVPDGFVLSHTTMAQAQARMPNRNGLSTDHGLWPGKSLGQGGRPDVQAKACMAGCGPAAQVVSSLPDHARHQHGNLADQQRLVGAQRGAQTAPASAPAATASTGATGLKLAQQHGCTACHGLDSRIVGPGFREIAAKHAGRNDAGSYLTAKIKAGGQGQWGAIPMPAQSLPEGDARLLAQWLSGGAKP